MKPIDIVEIAIFIVAAVIIVVQVVHLISLDSKLKALDTELGLMTLSQIKDKSYTRQVEKKLEELELEVKFMQLEPLASVLCEDLSIRTGQIGKLQVIRHQEHGAVCAAEYDKYYTIQQMRDMLPWFN